MEITIEAKYILAAAKCIGKDESCPIMTGVHVIADESGWRVESTDSYKLVRIEQGTVTAPEFDVVLPPDAWSGTKATDKLVIEAVDEPYVKIITLARHVSEKRVKRIEGKYPNVDNVIPDSIPSGCYRYVGTYNGVLLADLMGAANIAFGKKKRVDVEFATMEDTKTKPLFGFASEDGVKMTMVLMPIHEPRHSRLAEPLPKQEDAKKLREELKAAQANAEMWKTKALKLEGDLAEKVEQAAEDKAGADVEVAAAKVADGITEVVIAPKRKKAEKKEEQVKQEKPTKKPAKKETTKKVAKAKKEPAAKKQEKKPEQTEKVAEVATEVSLATMQKWCEGKGLKAKQKREGCPVWILGPSKPYKEELKSMGFTWGQSKDFGKGWYVRVA